MRTLSERGTFARMSLSGRVALVTGAGSPTGIGFATAQLLAEKGARVAISSTTGRIEARANELVPTGVDVVATVAELTSREQTEHLLKEVLRHYSRIDILVNNAGMIQVDGASTSVSFDQLTEEQWDYGIAINLKTAFHATKAVLPAMLAAGYGRIVNVASVTGPVVSNPRETTYSAAKAAMVGLTRSLALEVARKGITVNAVAPGWIETASSTDEEIAAGRNTPIGRPGRPEEVAAAIAIRAVAGKDYEMAVIPEQRRKYLSRYDAKSTHYEIASIHKPTELSSIPS